MNYAPTPNAGLPVATFLLAGGASSRMGRDKALLKITDKTLLEHLAELLISISPDFHLLAPPCRYESFGFPAWEDARSGCGPLAGIETALENSAADWNLILACDLALMERDWLQQLCDEALRSTAADCVVSATTPDSPNPLCAMWRKSALPAVKSALDRGDFRVRSVLETLKTKILIPPNPGILANWNSPEDLPSSSSARKAIRGG